VAAAGCAASRAPQLAPPAEPGLENGEQETVGRDACHAAAAGFCGGGAGAAPTGRRCRTAT